MGEKVGLKRCIVGKGCWIGKGSKLTGCVLMKGCRVGEGYVFLTALPLLCATCATYATTDEIDDICATG